MGAQTDAIKFAVAVCRLILRIGGTDFFHCLFTDSVWLERAELLITFMAAYLEC